MTKIYIIGSGWAASNFIKNIDTTKYEVYVISPTENFIYTPLLANNIKNSNNLAINVNNLNDVKLIKTYINNFDVEKNKVITDDNRGYNYDYLILAHGAEINTFGIPGIKENCYCLKSIEDSIKIRNKLKQLPVNSKIAVIGCSLTGSEVIGNLIDYNKFNIFAIDGLPRPLSLFNNNIKNFTENLWDSKGVKLYMNNFVSKVEFNNIFLKNKTINYDMAIWCGGIKISPLSILLNKYLCLESKFGIPVDKNLKVQNSNNIFAIGDCAYSGNPPTAQVATQQGIYLAKYFNNNFKGNDFKFKSKGQICYIGDGNSVYQNNNLYFKGKLTGYFNNFVHLYNSINLDQIFNFLKK